MKAMVKNKLIWHKIHLVIKIFIISLVSNTLKAQVLQEDKNRPDFLLDTVIKEDSFNSERSFEKSWNYFYPWGDTHNGSAKMYKKNIALLKGGILKLTSEKIYKNEGISKNPPYLKINYHSGAVFSKELITVTDSTPQYVISGYFKAPTKKGTWPAFWLTAAKSWPPEIDILEYKGNHENWQNTFTTTSKFATKRTFLIDADSQWHQYKVILKKYDSNHITVEYYIDNRNVEIHDGTSYMNKPLHLIINLQMEAVSGEPGPSGKTNYFAKDVEVIRFIKRDYLKGF